MADAHRTSTHSVARLRRLEEKPFRFGFYSALRLLECHFGDRPRLGQSLRATDDGVRLGQSPSLAFAPASLAYFTFPREDRAAHLSVLLFGLLGPNGALPIHLTEYIRDRLRNDDDPTLARFLDLFHHRMLSLFYRAWANSQPTVQADRPQDDRFRLYVGSLFGLGLSSLQDRDRVPDSAKLYYAGALGCQNRHAGGLRALLAEFFGMPVALEEFVGQWIVLPERDRLYLGASSATGLLGVNSTVGERIYDCQQKFRVRFGPMGYEDYLRMLPGSDSLKRLVDLVRSYIGFELDWDVNLVLKKNEIPALKLDQPRQLGRTAWLLSRPAERDASDLKLQPAQ